MKWLVPQSPPQREKINVKERLVRLNKLELGSSTITVVNTILPDKPPMSSDGH
jgi:hypothetical protein